jgi:hypothetical protein
MRILAANIGDTDAIIIQLGLSVYFQGAVADAPPVDVQTIRIRPGMQGQLDAEGIVNLTQEEGWNFAQHRVWLRILGIINYRDERGIIRSTAFSRFYDHGMRRFVPVPNDDPESDREYED